MSHNECIGRNSNYPDRNGPPTGPRSQSRRFNQGRPRYDSYVPSGGPFISAQQQGLYRRTDPEAGVFSPSTESHYTPQALSGPHYDNIPGMTPAKRNASRSPDGSNGHRKAARANSLSEDAGERRQKSSKNNNLVNSSADPRKRLDKTNASVLSPVSTDGSAYQDGASARSTPQHQQPKPQTALMSTSPNTPINNDDNALQAPLRDTIETLVFNMAKDVSLRASCDLAEHKSKSAATVHENMEPYFSKYPAIQERTSNDKSKADDTVAKLKQQLGENSNAQATLASSLFEALWSISCKAGASAQIRELHPDAVSRKEYDNLHTQFQEQQQLLQQQRDRFDQQASLIEKLGAKVAEMDKAAVKSKDQASMADRNIKLVTALETRVQSVESTTSNQRTYIEQCQTNIARNKVDLIAQEEKLNTIDRSVKSIESQTSTSREDSGKLERRVTTIQNEVGQIWNEISEQGKAPVLRRLKSHDQMINNIWTKVDSSTKPVDPARIELLDERVASLTEDLDAVKNARAQESSEAIAQRGEPAAALGTNEPSSSFDLDAFRKEVVDDATELVTALSEAFDSHTSKIEQLQEEHSSLQKQVEDAGLEHKNAIRQLDEAHDTKHASAREDQGKFLATIAAYKNEADSLRSDIASLEKTVKSLQDRPSPVTTIRPQAVQFRPITAQSPLVNSPVTGVSPGGMHAPNILPSNGSPVNRNPTNGSPVVTSNHDIKVLQDQMNGVCGTISSLRQRYDNLTTEEVAKAMVDQSSKIYPAAKDFQKAVTALQEVDNALEGRLRGMDTRVIAIDNALAALSHHFNEYAVNQREHRAYKTEVGGHLQGLQNSLTNASNATAQLREEITKTVKDAEKRVDAAVECQNDTIVKIKSELTALANKAFGKELG